MPDLLDLMGIPINHWDAKFRYIPDGLRHKEVVREYCDNIRENLQKGQGLYLWGEYSTGKSALAAICLKAAANHRIVGRWVRAKELPNIQISKQRDESEGLYYETLKNCPLLVLDEFQMREDIKYTENLAEDVIRFRIDNKLSTVITSNVVVTDLKQRYPALYAVLQEAVYPVKVHGHDFRQPRKGRAKDDK